MKRSEGERVRAAHIIERLRATIHGIEVALQDHRTPVGAECGQAITGTACDLAVTLAKLDAYQRAENDTERT